MGKRILITGGSGLIGSYLVDALSRDASNKIYIVGRQNAVFNRSNVFSISIDFNSTWHESSLPADTDAIIHLSQAENFREFPGKAKEVFNINTVSTMRLIDFAVENGVKHFIYASSGGIYGNNDKKFTEEQDIIYKGEIGFYLATKHCSEVILSNYFNRLNVAILRFFFVYGKGQRKSMLIPRLLDFVKNGEPIILQGSEGMRINPVHALDASNAICAALLLKESHIINVAGPRVLSLRHIGEIMGDLLDIKPRFIVDEKTEAKNLIGDITKMSHLLNSPVIELAQGIKTII